MHLQKLFKASTLPLLTSCSQRFPKIPSNKPVMKGSCKRYFTKEDSVGSVVSKTHLVLTAHSFKS